MTDLEFVNDWAPLEAAIETLQHFYDKDFEDFDVEDYIHDVECLISYVPRLLTQYASLLETSFALTGGWEQHAAICPLGKTGLYLPDHR